MPLTSADSYKRDTRPTRARAGVPSIAAPCTTGNFSMVPASTPQQPIVGQRWPTVAVPGPAAALQRKLIVGQADDPLEAEADRIADNVIHLPTPAPATVGISRKCACQEDEIRRSATSPGARDAPTVVRHVLDEPGRPLDAQSRAFFEPRLGMGLGHVRIHDDARAATSARAVGARAYTVGNHIAFAGSADPVSETGRRLLAHELVHVVQQTSAAEPRLARDEAPFTPAGPSGALASAVDTIADYRERAAAALTGSGLASHDAARIRRNLAACAAGERRLRGVAQAGDDAASAAVLAAFTREGMRQVIPHLTRVQPTPRAIAVKEAPGPKLAATPAGSVRLGDPVEREAERVAAELVPASALTSAPPVHGTLRRLLSAQDAQQIEQAVAPAAPALVAGAAATAAAIATAPLWVWVVVAVVVVAVAAAALYWVFSDDDPKTSAKATPQPQAAPQPSDNPHAEEKPEEKEEEQTNQKKKKKRKCRSDPCEDALPISWPGELPNPRGPRQLRRTSSAEREWEGIDRAADQSRLAKEIADARRRLLPPPQPCFKEDTEPNAPYDAHHGHPLYLGGEDAEWNLCALRTDRHQAGHPRLNDQTSHLAEYMECGICSGFLSQHPIGQTYEIVASK